MRLKRAQTELTTAMRQAQVCVEEILTTIPANEPNVRVRKIAERLRVASHRLDQGLAIVWSPAAPKSSQPSESESHSHNPGT
jgi:hypothetical protein